MEFSQLIADRHSTRSFSEREVTTEQLEIMVKEASQTASWVNSQPWKVYVATGATLQAIRDDHKRLLAQGVKSSPVFPVLSRTGFQPDQQANMAQWSEEQAAYSAVDDESFWQLNRDLFHAPAIVYIGLPKASPLWSVLDLGAFLQTLSLSANNQGLATMVAYEFTKFPAALADRLSLDPHYEVAIGMAVGYEDDHPVNQFRASRRSLDDLLTILD
ncbi:nitroreductase [Streptococcus entericus]|uniref:nitroreductase n=1 Tax=Streptococcus entericus TaxID=155680 RepID=UPI00036654B5|nr:nitroreductase [Streptococcus entericus]